MEKLITIAASLLLGALGGLVSAVVTLLIVMGVFAVATWAGLGERAYWAFYIGGGILIALVGFAGFVLTVWLVAKSLGRFANKLDAEQ